MTFEEFVAARLAALMRYATVLTCDPPLAEDIVQDVMLRAHGRWGHIGALDMPEFYVKRMILNEFLSWRRRRRARVGQLHETLLPAVPDHAGRVDERDALVRHIAALPPRQRAVLALRFFDDRTDSEIAALLGCGQATVRSHASQALATLRKSYSQEGELAR